MRKSAWDEMKKKFHLLYRSQTAGSGSWRQTADSGPWRQTAGRVPFRTRLRTAGCILMLILAAGACGDRGKDPSASGNAGSTIRPGSASTAIMERTRVTADKTLNTTAADASPAPTDPTADEDSPADQTHGDSNGETQHQNGTAQTDNDPTTTGTQGFIIQTNPKPYVFPRHMPLPPMLTGNETVTMDIGNVSNGVIRLQYKVPVQKKIKVIIEKEGSRYTYDLPGDGSQTIYPLQMGSGTYSVLVAENIQGSSYVPVYQQNVEAAIADFRSPYLNPSQIIWYTENSAAVKLAWDLVTGIDDSIQRAEAVHRYIIQNIRYDYDRASNVQPGYIPDIDQVLIQGKGICFDYAALFAAMMRSLDIPAKLVMGYVSPQNVYHAWNEIYIEGKGWIKVVHAQLQDKGWALVDATFDAAGAGSTVGDGGRYQKTYEY
ncbi:MAG TPA: hypothetical protein DD727_09115 [Clostridiales bacterium]|nr:hypothetical protein [Clostridiales bacterium]